MSADGLMAGLRRMFAPGVVRALFVACLLVLAGCKTDLYSNLTEVEANEMMAILMSNGVPAQKALVGEGFTISVEESDLLSAIALLNDRGYPRNTRQSIGDIFQKSGIMSSPFEERVRYIYALSEDVAATLSQIDGVVTARVHIVQPPEPSLGQPVQPSSAAVFIRHRPEVDLDFFVPQIRRLVSSSIQGLEYSAVTVVLAEAAPTETFVPPSRDETTVEVLPGLAIREADSGLFWQIAYGVGGLLTLLFITSIIGLFALFRSRRGRRRDTSTAVAVLEPS
jgi:type III secretion protein J